MFEEIDFGDDFYNPKYVGIVLDVSDKILEKVKQEIIPALKSFDSNDVVYIYHPLFEELPDKIGKTIGMLGRYQRPLDFDPGEAVADTIYLFCEQDLYADKTIFIITDNYQFKSFNNLLKSFKIDKRYNFDFQFHIIGIGDKSREMANIYNENVLCTFKLFDTEIGIADYLRETSNGTD